MRYSNDEFYLRYGMGLVIPLRRIHTDGWWFLMMRMNPLMLKLMGRFMALGKGMGKLDSGSKSFYSPNGNRHGRITQKRRAKAARVASATRKSGNKRRKAKKR